MQWPGYVWACMLCVCFSILIHTVVVCVFFLFSSMHFKYFPTNFCIIVLNVCVSFSLSFSMLQVNTSHGNFWRVIVVVLHKVCFYLMVLPFVYLIHIDASTINCHSHLHIECVCRSLFLWVCESVQQKESRRYFIGWLHEMYRMFICNIHAFYARNDSHKDRCCLTIHQHIF